MTAEITFSIPQLCLLRSLLKAGIPADLIHWFPPRCGATEAEWQALRDAGMVNLRAGRFRLSTDGKREYRRQSKGRYF